ncbi:MAG: glycerol-3-phosphate 1-O-acyltransferase PlsY [Clostridia bacterium]|nr:glycerol-3-phosphate 1-O-acyltransferase PlsY [Clostridia bacterium]
MAPIPAFLLSAACGYLLGSVSTGIIYSRMLGRDIRTQGSKNSGATNMTRVHGFKEGFITFLGDCVKGVLAALIGLWLGGLHAAMIAGLFALIGHMWPVFFGFRGGKGVSTAIGVGLVTFPLFGGIAVAVGGAVMLLSRYVSLGSIMGMAVFGLTVSIVCGLWPAGVWAVAMAALVIVRHSGNIGRLLHGTERRMGQKEQ